MVQSDKEEKAKRIKDQHDLHLRRSEEQAKRFTADPNKIVVKIMTEYADGSRTYWLKSDSGRAHAQQELEDLNRDIESEHEAYHSGPDTVNLDEY